MNPDIIYIIALLPLLAFLANGLFGRWLKGAGPWLAFGAMAGSAAISSMLLFSAWTADGHAAATGDHAETEVVALGADEAADEAPHGDGGTFSLPLEPEPLWEWISVGSFSLDIGFRYDQLTAIMCFVVTFVGALVFLYAIGYMHGDPGITRFFAYLSLFAFSMLVLVLADSFLLLFVGWEGVGLCSYLLIGYYLDMPGAPQAGKKAFVVNRIGDVGFLLAMFLIFKHLGTLDIAEVVAMTAAGGVFTYGGATITAITLLLFLACTGKSAQIPLFVWLPDAMAGPTPVSAFIHAATMVTAGVYLVVRTSALFVLAPATMATMATIGALTAFVAGTIALTQRDIKKVLAYSTVSQLGYMFLACGVGAFAAGIFHVFTHAFFKACLFLGAGAVIHATRGTQDLFLLGGLRKKIPVVAITFLISCFAIAGFPLTAGFFSKDEILWMSYSAHPDSLRVLGMPVLYFLALLTALMTGVYSFRVYFLTFSSKSRLPADVLAHLHKPGWTMKLPLIVLAGGALFAGFLNVPTTFTSGLGLGEGASFHHFLQPVLAPAEAALELHPLRSGEAPGAGMEVALAILSSILAIVAILIARRYARDRWPDASAALAEKYRGLYDISSARWWWDDLYNFVFGRGIALAGRLAVWFDENIIDGVLHGVAATARGGGAVVRSLQAGQVQVYALVALIGANILLAVVWLW